jgi:acyl carrier protein phosphodiesterase
VVSTSVRDVVRMFGDTGFLAFADTAAEFIEAVEGTLGEDNPQRQARVDQYLAMQSWDRTWARMQALMARSMSNRPSRTQPASRLGLSLPSSGVLPASVQSP